MNLPSYFKQLRKEVEPSPSYKSDQQRGHRTLRDRLANDDDFGKIHVNTFLQGSYARSTAIHPGKDVDIVVVTSLNPDDGAAEANRRLQTCLSRYYDDVTAQARSYCVKLSYVVMDVVLATSHDMLRDALLAKSLREAASLELSGYGDGTLLIPDRSLNSWVPTNPKRQMAWTAKLNANCGGYFVPLVKLFKWWRQESYKVPKRPKGFLLERMAGEFVDTTKRDDAEGFVSLLDNLVSALRPYVSARMVPALKDPGIDSGNVLSGLEFDHFATFVDKAEAALATANGALREPDKARSAELWRQVFGEKFPKGAQAKSASFPPAPVRPPNKPAGFA